MGSDANEGKRRTNVVFILTDDQGYGDLGCFGGKGRAAPALYDLKQDIGETRNVLKNHPDVTARLRAHVAAFEEDLLPAMEKFRPEFVLISAGFDAHEADPLGSLRVTDAGFRRLSEIVRGIADRHAEGRLVAFLEGGYNLDVLGRCVCDFLDVFS